MRELNSRSRLLLLSILIGLAAGLIGNIVAIEIILEVFKTAEFNDPTLQQYVGRIAISFAVVVWLSVFASLYVGRLRDTEARQKARKEREEIYLHRDTSLVNARWLDQVLSAGRDPFSGEHMQIDRLTLYVVSWWSPILRYFKAEEKNKLNEAVLSEIKSLHVDRERIGYLGYGVFFGWQLDQKILREDIYLKEIDFNGMMIALSSLQIDTNNVHTSYRVAQLANNFSVKIEHGVGKNESREQSLPVIDPKATSAWDAVARGDISFVFQPIYSLSNNEIVSFEMLARLTAIDGSSIPITDDVADIFENSPLCIHFHKRLLKELRIFQKEINAVSKHISISINIPAPMLTRHGFWAILKSEINAGLRLDMVAIELTERTLPARSPEIERALSKLKSFGAKIYLDDFGAGQSSVETISNYQFSLVKIDRAFIYSPNWEKSKSFSLVNFLKSYTDLVLAEGIEDLETAEAFKLAGANLVQGYVFSRPLGKGSAIELLKTASLD